MVPVWRAGGFIDDTLDALAAQSWSDFEVLISDDASPDDTAARCAARAAADPRFRLLRQPRNLGWVGNSNALLAAARGDYLLFAFQDDLPAPRYVERCVAALERDAGAVLAFTDIELVHADGRREPKSYPLLDGVGERLSRALVMGRRTGSWWIPNRGVFRAAAARAVGGLRRHAAGEFSADWPWLLQLALLGRFVRVPESLCVKIYREGSLSRSWRHGAGSWCAVTVSALRAAARADLGPGGSARLAATLATGAVRETFRATRRSVVRRLRASAPRA
jgi:glycosyltransferase involved in cell wall biosynthesis